MKYLSVCAGIEAASVAWHDMGWEPVAFSEIEKFPSAVLAHHYPNVPNWGDMTKFKEWPDANINVLVGGTPCQSFSVAGLRKGLDDPRGNLMLTYLGIAKRYRPQWLVWENVPGVLSSEGGRDFAALLRGLDELGYGWAYRVLDAQYFGVAQRRRRVFVVGYLGDWHRAAAVLFERHSLSGNPAPSRKTGKATPALSASGTGISRPGFNSEAGFYVAERTGTLTASMGHNPMGAPEVDGGFYIPWPAEIAPTLNCAFADKQGLEDQHVNGGCGLFVPAMDVVAIGFHHNAQACQLPTIERNTTISDALTCSQQAAVAFAKTDVHAVAFSCKDHGADAGEIAPTLRSMGHAGSHANGGGQLAVAFGGDVARSLTARYDSSPCADRGMDVVAVAMRESGQGYWMQDEVAGTLRAEGEDRPSRPSHVISQTAMQVRRLTPVECERLQGFPDGYTNIPWRNKDESPDGPRYKALGNSMAVPVMRWIGERINKVEAL